jgi:hypothetical protein
VAVPIWFCNGLKTGCFDLDLTHVCSFLRTSLNAWDIWANIKSSPCKGSYRKRSRHSARWRLT